MSNIYIQEPPTNGKVLLETSAGEIDIELWGKECPKACRNFIQLCLESYYNGTIFHRVVKGFIAQGGDPTGTGTGGESIYGSTFKDEFHSRLRFVRRGLVAMANAGKDDNGSQFFFTLNSCPELQNKHTIFGKVSGNTLYNMLKLEDCMVDRDDRPMYPHKIIKAKVLSNPFDDIIPRQLKKEGSEKKLDTGKRQSKATKNFKLLSFGDEAEEDEEEVNIISKVYRGKSKSSHDLTDDPHLSSVPAFENLDVEGDKKFNSDSSSEESDDTKKNKLEDVRGKLKRKKSDAEDVGQKTAKIVPRDKDETDENDASKPLTKVEQLRKEVKLLKKELSKAKRSEKIEDEPARPEDKDPIDEAARQYQEETEKYREIQKSQPKKGSAREQQTMALLAKFQNKLQMAKELVGDEPEDTAKDEDDEEEDVDEVKWLTHALHCETHEAKVKDANMKDEDTYEIYDPRNPINLRRREASKQAMQNKKR